MGSKVSCVLIALLGPICLVGCAYAPVELPTYTVRGDVFEATPPAPVQIAPADASSPVVEDEVKIEPEKSVGYENLTPEITELYDAAPLPLALGDVVVETLANNRAISIEGYTLRVGEYEIPVQKGIYDLVLRSTAEFQRVEEERSSAGVGANSFGSERFRTFLAGVSQLLPSGATVDLGYSIVRSTALVGGLDFDFAFAAPTASSPFGTFIPVLSSSSSTDVNYSHVFSAAIVQPLLRGFGPKVTNAGIRIAQLERRGAAADFQTAVEQTLVTTLNTYWELIGAIENYKVQVITYSAALDLLRINKAKYEAQVMPLTDVLQAEAAVEERREFIIVARQDVRDLEDELKRLIFLQEDAPLWDAQIAPTQAFAWREIEADLDETVEVALGMRSEMRRAQSNIGQAKVNVTVAENNILPRLDLVGEIQSSGLDGDGTGAYRTGKDGDFVSYRAALEFTYPLQNRAARYRRRQAQSALEQTEESLRDLVDRITLEVREATRELRTTRERIDVTQARVRSQQALLDSEMKRYEVGIATAFEVLDFQDTLADAQSNHLRAVVDYNEAAIALERARGTLLETYGVQVQQADLKPPEPPVTFPIGFD